MTNPADRTRGGGAGNGLSAGKLSLTPKPDSWSDTFTAARCWVDWTARRRWPLHATNDDIWAVSVADWWHGGQVRRG